MEEVATSEKEKEDVPYPPYQAVASINYHMFVGLLTITVWLFSLSLKSMFSVLDS